MQPHKLVGLRIEKARIFVGDNQNELVADQRQEVEAQTVVAVRPLGELRPFVFSDVVLEVFGLVHVH